MADTANTELTARQADALQALAYRWQDAEEIGASAATLTALVGRGLADRRRFIGTARRAEPFRYRITTAGVRASNTARLAAKAAARTA